MITGLPIPKTRCKAKDPATCRYHGAYTKLNEIYVELLEVVSKHPDHIGGILNEYYEARRAVDDLEQAGWVEEQQAIVPKFSVDDLANVLKKRENRDLLPQNPEDVNYLSNITINGITQEVVQSSFWEGKPGGLAEIVLRIGTRSFQIIGEHEGLTGSSFIQWKYDSLTEID